MYYSKPIGLAEYKLALPTIAELEAELSKDLTPAKTND